MTITVAACGALSTPVTVIELQREYGSGDFHTLADLEEVLLQAIDNQPAVLLIDLSETTGIGCGLINTLLRCSLRAAPKECELVLCGLGALQLSTLQMLRLDTYWSIFPSSEQAIEALQRRDLPDQAMLAPC